MNRRSMFRSLFGLAGAAVVPTVKADEPKIDKRDVSGILVFYYPEGDQDSHEAAMKAVEAVGERYAVVMPRPRLVSPDTAAELLMANQAGVERLNNLPGGRSMIRRLFSK
jgi:hypothetical protein